jgi:hypothetical protein
LTVNGKFLFECFDILSARERTASTKHALDGTELLPPEEGAHGRLREERMRHERCRLHLEGLDEPVHNGKAKGEIFPP